MSGGSTLASPVSEGQTGPMAEVAVLVVDDQRPFRLAAKATLARTPGFTMVGEAADGSEAVEAVAVCGADLVLMDVKMPLMDGIDATRAVLAARPETVVFLCSTYQLEELPAEARTSGARAYINKEDLSPQLLVRLWAAATSPESAEGLLTG